MKQKKNPKTLHNPILLVGFSLVLSACTPAYPARVTVMLEDGNYSCANKRITLDKGSDFTFFLTLPYDYSIFGSSYSSYSLVEEIDLEANKRYETITFFEVKYDTLITLDIDLAGEVSYSYGDVTYEETINMTHLRANVSNDFHLFFKPGHKLCGYLDEGGNLVSLGSRTDIGEDKRIELEPYFLKESNESDFLYEKITEDKIKILSYLGKDKEVVIPESIDGYRVYSIEKGAFSSLSLSRLVLPKDLNSLKEGAIKDTKIEELVLYDALEEITDASFMGSEVSHIRINAVSNPAYLTTYFGSYPDKFDRLRANKDKRKIVLYSGSSTRFGFDSSLIDASFQDYEVINMGVYAYTETLPQIDALLPYMKEGDILIASPEFDTLETQMNADNGIDYAYFAMVEGDYDILFSLTPSKYDGFFSSLGTFLSNRKNMNRCPYSFSPNLFDEDGNRISTSSYNEYGDYCLYRSNNEEKKSFGIRRAYYNKEYFPKSDIDLFNAAYLPLKKKGVSLYYDYSPRMDISLSSDSTKESIRELGKYLEENIDMDFLSSIEDSLVSPYYFYGTDNHLSSEGAAIRTKKVIDSLKKRIEG
ncbi:MAG: leucine-rich repeat protein [Bacilli bacterium]|nr:leucine-rich repeat protein [Bacilli bacterium]